jgi:hypothetical protein
MVRKLIILFVVLATVAGVVCYFTSPWEWFRPSPAATLKDTFAKANAGQFAAAAENVNREGREQLERDSARATNIWKALTKN